MGLDLTLRYMAGVPFDSLTSQPVRRTVPLTRYKEDTGAPYQKDVDLWEMTLKDNTVITQDMGDYSGRGVWSKAANHIRSKGLEVGGCDAPEMVGVYVGGHESRRGAQVMHLTLPPSKQVNKATKQAYDKLLAAGFKIKLTDVKVHAVLEVSS